MKTKTPKPQPAQSAPVAAAAPVILLDAAAATERLDTIIQKLDGIAVAIAEGTARADARADAADQRAKELRAEFEDQVKADRKIFDDLRNTNAKRDRGLEETFAAALPGILKPRGVTIAPRQVRTRVRNTNHSAEFDIVAANGEVVYIGEVKLHLTFRDVLRFHDALLRFRGEFPQHAKKRLHGMVAGMLVDDSAVLRARRFGFYILQMSGGQIYPDTPKNFRPRAY